MSAADTLQSRGDEVARWLEGQIQETATHGGPPDAETLPLIPFLLKMNRSGYVTDNSQPGERSGSSMQRATVSGHCRQEQAACLASLTLEGDLIVIVTEPGCDSSYQLPVSIEDGRTFTIAAGRGYDELRDHYFVEVIDPRWGRNELWPTVVAALERDPQDCENSLLYAE
jgi:hypothetical protein